MLQEPPSPPPPPLAGAPLARTSGTPGRTLLAPAAAQAQARAPALKVEVLAEGLARPWALGLLPDGEALLTERAGRLWRLPSLKAGTARPLRLSGVPKVRAQGQGGLLDVQPTPKFAETGEIVFAASVGNFTRLGTEVFRATLSSSRLTNVSRIFRAEPKPFGGRHFGCRLRFDSSGHLLFPVGDRGARDRAQDLGDDSGKFHRITLDGEPAPGNPFLAREGARETIYALGTRNAQGFAIRPATGTPWFHEHGPRGGDEVNILRPGANYGWPLVSHGDEYSGGRVSDATEAPGIDPPLWVWIPSIAPSGMDFWDPNADAHGGNGGDTPDTPDIPGALPPGVAPESAPELWGESIFLGGLVSRSLVRLALAPQGAEEGPPQRAPTGAGPTPAGTSGARPVFQQHYLENQARIREVRTHNSTLLLLTDHPRNGQLLRVRGEW